MRHYLLSAALAAFVAVPAAHADETWPNRTVTIIAPFAPGGIIDIASRIVGDALSERWGVSVVVENRAGGSGFIGAQAAAQADPDGYTLLAAEAGISLINELVFPSVPYSMMEDFVPITTMSDTPIVLAANAGLGISTVAEFIDLARAEEQDYSAVATASLNHLTGEWMAIEADLQFSHVPYRGGAPSAQALAAGEVPFGILAYSSVLPYVQTGDVVIIATTSAERIAADPDLPSLQEGGIANIDTSQWAALYARAGTDPAIVERLHRDVYEVLNDPDVQARFASVGARTIPQSREDFIAHLDRQREELRRIVELAGVTVN